MNILGDLGSLYMLILILLLIIAFGLVGWKFVNNIFNSLQQPIDNKNINLSINKIDIFKWLRIALLSFVGILISIMLLVIIKPI